MQARHARTSCPRRPPWAVRPPQTTGRRAAAAARRRAACLSGAWAWPWPGPQTGKRTPRPPRPGAAPARAIDAPHLAQGGGQSGGVAGARRREQGAVGRVRCGQGCQAKLRACESAHPGDAGVRVGRLERVHSRSGRAAAGLAAACAAQPAESWPPLQRSAVQAGNLRAETNAGGRVATVRCTGIHATL